MMTFREFVEYLEEISQDLKDRSIPGLLAKADAKRNMRQKLMNQYGKWKSAPTKVIDKLDRESKKHADCAAKIITGK